MSSGHRHGAERAASALADKYSAAAAKLVGACEVVRTYQCPWVANRSTDGKRVYIDSSVPAILKCGIDTGKSLPWHELPEWLAMNDGLPYDTGDPNAHNDVATPLERREVERQKPDDPDIWLKYTDEMDGYIKEVDDESIKSVPADIDLRVFADDDRALLEQIIAAQTEEEKRALTGRRRDTSAPKVIIAPERRIVELPRGNDGLFEQPDWSKMTEGELQDYARDMQKRRMRAAHDADFADRVTGIANTNDPLGGYCCGKSEESAGCNGEFAGRCVKVNVNRTDLNQGFKSCNKYEIKCAGDPEIDNPVLSPEEAGFVEAELPWGCKNCPLKEPSGFVDQLGRDLWCREWAITVTRNNCCAMNANPTIPLNPDGTRKE